MFCTNRHKYPFTGKLISSWFQFSGWCQSFKILMTVVCLKLQIDFVFLVSSGNQLSFSMCQSLLHLIRVTVNADIRGIKKDEYSKRQMCGWNERIFLSSISESVLFSISLFQIFFFSLPFEPSVYSHSLFF